MVECRRRALLSDGSSVTKGWQGEVVGGVADDVKMCAVWEYPNGYTNEARSVSTPDITVLKPSYTYPCSAYISPSGNYIIERFSGSVNFNILNYNEGTFSTISGVKFAYNGGFNLRSAVNSKWSAFPNSYTNRLAGCGFDSNDNFHAIFVNVTTSSPYTFTFYKVNASIVANTFTLTDYETFTTYTSPYTLYSHSLSAAWSDDWITICIQDICSMASSGSYSTVMFRFVIENGIMVYKVTNTAVNESRITCSVSCSSDGKYILFGQRIGNYDSSAIALLLINKKDGTAPVATTSYSTDEIPMGMYVDSANSRLYIYGLSNTFGRGVNIEVSSTYMTYVYSWVRTYQISGDSLTSLGVYSGYSTNCSWCDAKPVINYIFKGDNGKLYCGFATKASSDYNFLASYITELTTNSNRVVTGMVTPTSTSRIIVPSQYAYEGDFYYPTAVSNPCFEGSRKGFIIGR